MLVEQLSYIQPVLSVCFRNNKDATLAWPPGDDDALWCYFKGLGAGNKFTEEEMFAALLGALVEEATESLVPNTSTLDSDHRKTFSGWDFGPPGSQAVKRGAHLSSAVERAKTRLRRHKSEATCPVLQPASSWHTSLFQQFCLPYFKTLAARLQNLGYEFAFIAFDECRELSPAQRKLQPYISLIGLQRIFKAADRFALESGFEFWFLLLDTDPEPSLVLPSGQAEYLPPPFTSNSRGALMLSHLQKYGRPYWSTLPVGGLVETAKIKLFSPKRKSDHKPFFDSSNIQHVIAAFASRVHLELVSTPQTALFAAESVRQHMRILDDVNRDILITSAPSEPSLAIAAMDSIIKYGDSAWKSLLREVTNGQITLDQGSLGQLWTGLLFTLARDKSTVTPPIVHCGEDAFVRPVALNEFLETLLGKNFGLPSNDSTKLREFTKNKWMNFTHVVVLEKPFDNISRKDLERLWSVGAMVQCRHSQPVIDGGIVIYEGDFNSPFELSQLNLVPWQTKNKSASASSSTGSGITGPHIINDDGSREKRPTVILLMDLLETSYFVGRGGRSVQLTERRATKAVDCTGYADEEPLNFLLNIRGYTAGEYPVCAYLEQEFVELFELQHRYPQDLQIIHNRFQQAKNPLLFETLEHEQTGKESLVKVDEH
ncbi:hypothetical protein BDP27DRAFT_1353196 [Rhodocollybia butyracea]|uniref:Uncharacterized protein n=1 Tax=Rhodocollybia butyracea TaxID=206335 RepID=A0A9P5TUL0_9AGAR|nr:hypothetical protein BDP27DRAFT_1353196 [Rhodocollybia butyracea]